jgi:hypothetical protein
VSSPTPLPRGAMVPVDHFGRRCVPRGHGASRGSGLVTAPSPDPRPALRRLARLRVPAGFALGGLVWWLAAPTPTSMLLGSLMAVAGEGLRVWAAGHLEKGREVTKSGPYRWMRHPLYVGSGIMGVGLAIGAASIPAGVVIVAYEVVMFGAAIRHEEAVLRDRFGPEYDEYREGRLVDDRRVFSAARAWRNREHRTLAGLVVVFLLLGIKGW